IHAGHQKLAVRKVDELHHAEHQIEAHGDQRVNTADQEPVDDRLQKDHGAAPAAIRRPVARLKYIPTKEQAGCYGFTTVAVATPSGNTVRGTPPCHWIITGKT